jgi:(p)ppGpp synthase/HD superfamily hydrolase
MLYTQLTKKSLSIAYDAHKNQLDKSGLPYIFHPFYLAEQMNDEYSICVALLHDVVEDNNYTIQEIENMGFPLVVVDAIRVLTHDNEIPYFDYINRIKDNQIARIVKIEDLKHNFDLTRLNEVREEDLKRIEKYKKALCILEN